MVRKASKKVVEEAGLVRSLVPKDEDSKYFGEEPSFLIQPTEDNRGIALARAFNWYNKFYNKKDAKEFLAQYLDLNNKATEAKTIRRVADNEIIPTIGWLSRMTLRGIVLVEYEKQTLDNEIGRLLDTIYKPEVKEASRTGGPVKSESPTINKPNVQEIMREKASEAAGELEGLLDDFISAGAPTKHTYRPIDELAKKNVLPQHVSFMVETWNKKLIEFTEVQEGKDDQLVQGYMQLSKQQVKNIIKFIELVLSEIGSYVTVKKVNKAPRKRKAVPVEKQVSKLKYLREFVDAAAKLNLTSLHPTKLHGASEAWVYDTSRRKLHHYIADEYSKYFTVKGNTLLGFDTTQSECKTLRKPAEQLKEIMGSKPAARKYFKEVKAVSVTPTGRFNEHMIILKAF